MGSMTVERGAAGVGPQAIRGLALTRVLSVAVLIAETVCVAVAVAHESWTALLVVHASTALVLVLTIIILDRSDIDSSQLQKVAFLTFVAGPIGAAAGILSDATLWRSRNEALAAWYQTIAPPEDGAVTLVDRIIDGRLISNESQLPRRFDKLLTHGSMAEKQAVLAYLALENGKPDVSNALRLALRSPDQRVRVQAAAVAAHVRDKARRPVGAGEEKLPPTAMRQSGKPQSATGPSRKN